MEYRVITKAMNLYPYQHLFFTTIDYGELRPMSHIGPMSPMSPMSLESLKGKDVLLLTGIASPKQMLHDLQPFTDKLHPLTFGDHHQFKRKDVESINREFAALPSPKIVITTEKDAVRLSGVEGLSDEVKQHLYVLPIEIKFMLDQQDMCNETIIGCVRKNSRNSILVKGKNDHKSQNSHRAGNGPRTISFRNN